jgi:hypothetical protein
VNAREVLATDLEPGMKYRYGDDVYEVLEPLGEVGQYVRYWVRDEHGRVRTCGFVPYKRLWVVS